jgi:hypothetical protein
MPGKWRCATAIVRGIRGTPTSKVPAYVTADHSRQRRLNPTASSHQPCRTRILHISLPARARGSPLLCIHFVLRNTSHPQVIFLFYSQYGSHQGRLLAPVPNTAICPLLLLRRHYSRYVLICRDTVICTANVLPRHLLLLPRSTRRSQPGHSHLAKGC